MFNVCLGRFLATSVKGDQTLREGRGPQDPTPPWMPVQAIEDHSRERGPRPFPRLERGRVLQSGVRLAVRVLIGDPPDFNRHRSYDRERL